MSTTAGPSSLTASALRDVVPVALSVAPFALVVGAAATAVGVPPLAGAAVTAVLFAGGAQFAGVSLLAAGARPAGLPIRPVPVPGMPVVAAAWRPASDECAAELVWAVLDCPAFWALDLTPPTGATHVVTARMTAHLLAPIEAGLDYVVLGWALDRLGPRRLGVASAIHDTDGRLVARAEQVLVTTDWGWPLPNATPGLSAS